MSAEENKKVVQAIFEAFGRGDVPGVMEYVADDVRWDAPGPSVVPFYGERRGHVGATEFFVQLASNVDFEKFDVDEFVAEGDSVVVTGSERGRVRRTGKTYEMDWVLLFKVGGGKVTRFHCYDNTDAVAEAFR
ncbi:MAG: nuclear transport factor 2 family protein [Acidobacteria bacterium]|nr:nuclear transport factor 2 family protein [Acidobacteriota bacterium]